MKSNIREYLNFTRKERLGILILVVIILLVAIAPAFFEPAEISEDSTALAELRSGIVMLEQAQQDQKDSFRRSNAYYTESGTENRFRSRAHDAGMHTDEVKMFYFDPNTLDPAGWKKLGVREKTIATITKYVAKGGKFLKAEDLLKIYGLSDADRSRLLPFVRLTEPSGPPVRVRESVPMQAEVQVGQNATPDRSEQTAAARGVSASFYPKKFLHDIDINKADTTEWKTLPGIGSALSSRIVKYRERLGGFHRAAQVAEVYGLQDSVFQSLRIYLKCSPSNAKIHLNEVTPEVLEQHPYLRRQIARAIVDYRTAHGPYRQLEDLKQLVVMTPEIFEKIAPYLAL